MKRFKGWLSCSLLLTCLLLAACNDVTQQSQAISDLSVTETPAESATLHAQPSQAVTPTSTAQPTRTHTPTPTHTLEPTASPTPTELPPSPTPTPTAVPTREVQVAEGEVVYEREIGKELIRVAVPQQVVEILDAVEVVPSEYLGKETWMCWVEGDIVYLGRNARDARIPLFSRTETGWEYNYALIYQENRINMGPALVLSGTSTFENQVPAQLNRTDVFINDHDGGWQTISLNGFPVRGSIADVVALVDGHALVTQEARITIRFLNYNSGNTVEFTAPIYDVISINNSGGSPLAELAGRSRSGLFSIYTQGAPYPDALGVKLRGLEMTLLDSSALKSMIMNGSDLPDNTVMTSFIDNQ